MCVSRLQVTLCMKNKYGVCVSVITSQSVVKSISKLSTVSPCSSYEYDKLWTVRQKLINIKLSSVTQLFSPESSFLLWKRLIKLTTDTVRGPVNV